MTFRELLDKYRAGQASEEERAMVEAELEKSEAIADYLAEHRPIYSWPVLHLPSR